MLFIENVKNLLSINKGFDFLQILVELDEIGYDAEWAIIDSADVVPQHRERIFIIGHHRGQPKSEVFPIRKQIQNNSKRKKIEQLGNCILLNKTENYSSGNKIYKKDGIAPCLTSMQSGNTKPLIPVLSPLYVNKRQNGRRFKSADEPMFTLTASDKHGIYDGLNIRCLTPLECFRLQGFPDEYFYKASKVNSDSQLYKQIGNSVTVPVIYEIAKKLY